MNKLSVNAAVTAITSNSISVPVKRQETNYYCVPACIQMLCMYYKKPSPTPSQTSIYNYLKGKVPYGLTDSDIKKWVVNKWGKTPIIRTSAFNNIDVVTEIDNKRPFFSLIGGHCRVCRGYKNQDGYFYLYINDPMPGKALYEKTYGGSEVERIYVR